MSAASPIADARRVLLDRILAVIGPGEIPAFAQALTHTSFANEVGVPHNQRLEFLGDAVLGLCVSELLAHAHPDADEGKLSRMRSALVNADALAGWARRNNIGDALSMGRGARSRAERDETNVLADAVEALVAAVYDARGLEGARAFVADIVRQAMANPEVLDMRDPKGLLQERMQARGHGAPQYRVAHINGMAPDQTFVVEAVTRSADGQTRVVGRGEGRSKRLAEKAAAVAALAATESEAKGR